MNQTRSPREKSEKSLAYFELDKDMPEYWGRIDPNVKLWFLEDDPEEMYEEAYARA